jgi:(E)-4-hydroxy-3-methylbut-2-enyl-diphosphate synthase
VADVHFHFKRALEAVEAGVHKIRLNPGNISDRDQVREVIDACKRRERAGLPIRVGVNEGSIIERKDKQKRAKELGAFFSDHKHGYLLAIMIAKLEEYLDIFYERTSRTSRSAPRAWTRRSSSTPTPRSAQRFDHPLHLGVTHAGPKETGCIRSSSRWARCWRTGSGTRSASATPRPGLRGRGRAGAALVARAPRAQGRRADRLPDLRADPGRPVHAHPGRAQTLADEIEVPMKVAVMGCVVNGPGEAEGADVAVFAGDRKGIIYVQGERVATVPEDEILDRLLERVHGLPGPGPQGEAKLGEKKVDIVPPTRSASWAAAESSGRPLRLAGDAGAVARAGARDAQAARGSAGGAGVVHDDVLHRVGRRSACPRGG